MKNSQESQDVRQNIPYTKSRKHEANLRRNPTLHFQIGLILSLLVSIFFIEMRMPEKAENGPAEEVQQEEIFWVQNFEVEVKQVEKITKTKAPQPKVEIPEKFTEVDDDTKDIVEELVDFPDPDQGDEIPDNVIETTDVVEPVETPVDVPFIKIENVPIFPGCEGLRTNQERKDCMSSKITKFVSRKFRTEVGEGLGLRGPNRIFVQFTIDSNGDVTNIKARGPRVELEKEASRVINQIPKMIPGEQRGVPVGVIYSLPITFQIED